MNRYRVLDGIRGITLCSMILYHAVWDLVYMFGRDWHWYYTDFAYVWQQSICWCFILLSGFCFSLGHHKLKRGLMVFGAGTLVTVVTHLIMPAQRIRFGVLTMLGVSMLLLHLLEKVIRILRIDVILQKIPAMVGVIGSLGFFFLTKGINLRYLGFEGIRLFELPDSLYQKGDFMTFLGFARTGFYSTDYFSLMPWFFLFLTGYFLYHFAKEKEWLTGLSALPSFGKFFSFMGKHSLIIYMLHQPVIYGVLYVFA